MLPEITAGAKLLAGLKDPPDIGPATSIMPVTNTPITIPANIDVSFFAVTPKMVNIKKKVSTNSNTTEDKMPLAGKVSPYVFVSGKMMYKRPLARNAPKHCAKI